MSKPLAVERCGALFVAAVFVGIAGASRAELRQDHGFGMAAEEITQVANADKEGTTEPDYCKGMARPAEGARCAGTVTNGQRRAAHRPRAVVFAGVDTGAYCATWADNGMIGAAHRIRGKPLRFVYAPMHWIIEMIEHGMTDVDGILLAEDDYAPEERTFLEESVTEGWRWAQEHRDQNEPLPDYKQIREQFYEGCVSRHSG